jgi:hypothetical protein
VNGGANGSAVYAVYAVFYAKQRRNTSYTHPPKKVEKSRPTVTIHACQAAQNGTR